MRRGRNPYKQMLESTPISKFGGGYSSTTALGGMVRNALQGIPIPTLNGHSFQHFKTALKVL
jgi:hypothetical protein